MLILLTMVWQMRPLAAQALVGSKSSELAFATFKPDGTLVNRSLSEFTGKVFILYYFTPW